MAFTLLDDTYDAYGLFEELQQLTKAMERYSKDAMDELQGDYLKSIYEIVLNISDEVEEQVSKEGRPFSVSYTKAEVIKLVQSYHVQALWAHEHIRPTLDEYLENGKWSSGFIVTMALLMSGMEEVEEASYQWLMNIDAEFLRAPCVIIRLYNDIGSNEVQ
ncbi:hypothetical protein V6N13_039268 [Hibiscus sabdariffa]|uniref:Terpene synthase metal-binding domain-containing protein n=1 Tax=Hibiscus sabdariffa TaxID=183260 RepID=A0ABR1ZFY9_9ROSI